MTLEERIVASEELLREALDNHYTNNTVGQEDCEMWWKWADRVQEYFKGNKEMAELKDIRDDIQSIVDAMELEPRLNKPVELCKSAILDIDDAIKALSSQGIMIQDVK